MTLPQFKAKPSSVYLSFGFVTLLAAFFRLFHLSERGLEGIEVVYTRPPYSLLFENELVYYYVKPGYLFLLSFIGKIFGYTSHTVLYVSAISGILSVIFVFLIGKRLFNPTVGLISAFILSIMPYHVWISRMGMVYSPGILLFAISLFAYIFTFTIRKKINNYAVFALLGLINGIMFTFHPAFLGYTVALFCFDFFYYLFKEYKQPLITKIIQKLIPNWLFFSVLFFVPLISCELIVKDIMSENSFVNTYITNIKPTKDANLDPSYYFAQVKNTAFGGYKVWDKWAYGENLGYDYYIRIFLRESGFFNFFLIFLGVFFINFWFWKKNISFEHTLFANILLFSFIYWTFNPRIFFARRNFSPAVIPATLVSGWFLCVLLKNKKAFVFFISLVTIGSVMVSWQYVAAKAKFGYLVDFLNSKKIDKVMIIPGIVYPENPLLGNKNIQSLNLELYKKLYFQMKPEDIPNNQLVSNYLVCGFPEMEILGKKYFPTDKITGDICLYNDELFSYTYKDVFPWLKIGISKNAPLYYLYNLREDAGKIKMLFKMSNGTKPWSASGHLNIGEAFAAKGMNDLAEREYRLAIDLKKSDLGVLNEYKFGNLFFKIGRYAESKKCYQKVVGKLFKIHESSIEKGTLTKERGQWMNSLMNFSKLRIEQIDLQETTKKQ